MGLSFTDNEEFGVKGWSFASPMIWNSRSTRADFSFSRSSRWSFLSLIMANSRSGGGAYFH